MPVFQVKHPSCGRVARISETQQALMARVRDQACDFFGLDSSGFGLKDDKRAINLSTPVCRSGLRSTAKLTLIPIASTFGPIRVMFVGKNGRKQVQTTTDATLLASFIDSGLPVTIEDTPVEFTVLTMKIPLIDAEQSFAALGLSGSVQVRYKHPIPKPEPEPEPEPAPKMEKVVPETHPLADTETAEPDTELQEEGTDTPIVLPKQPAITIEDISTEAPIPLKKEFESTSQLRVMERVSPSRRTNVPEQRGPAGNLARLLKKEKETLRHEHAKEQQTELPKREYTFQGQARSLRSKQEDTADPSPKQAATSPSLSEDGQLVAQVYRERLERRELEEKMQHTFMTSAQRERFHNRFKRKYQEVLIQVVLPDHHSFFLHLPTTSNASDLFETITTCLNHEMEFKLITHLGELDPTLPLSDFAPAAKVYLRTDVEGPFIDEDVLNSFQDCTFPNGEAWDPYLNTG